MKPIVGDIVHYQRDPTGDERPAIVTTVWQGARDRAVNRVDLVVFALWERQPATSHLGIKEGNEPGTWHWPETQRRP